MNAKRSLRIATEIGELARIHAAVEELGQAAAWPPDLVYQVNLVLEELAVNIINYGHAGDPSHEIEVVLAWEADRLTIEMVDDAPAFNLLDDAPEPDLSSALEDRRVGGLGVYLVHTLMDELPYRREEGRNHLTLIKRRKG
jgi:anti-sigma regulatory factor (Ser/Thr protein kinase)